MDDGVSDLYLESGSRFKWTFGIVKVIDGDTTIVGAELPWQWTGQSSDLQGLRRIQVPTAWTQALFRR